MKNPPLPRRAHDPSIQIEMSNLVRSIPSFRCGVRRSEFAADSIVKTGKNAIPHSRDTICPRYWGRLSLEKTEGAGNAGCRSPHPRPRVRLEKAHECSHHRSSQSTGIPCAMVLTAYCRALPGVHDLFSHRRLAGLPRHLAPAEGCQDHTSSPSAEASHV